MKAYRNALRTKQWIKEAFTDLLSEVGTIDKITVQKLCEKADITKTTFYYHYADLYAVAEEFEQELIDKLEETLNMIEKDKPLDISNYIISVINFIKMNESDYKKAVKTNDIIFFKSKLIHIFTKKINEISFLFNFSKNEDEKNVQIYFFVSACVETMISYLKGDLNTTLDTVSNSILKIINTLECK